MGRFRPFAIGLCACAVAAATWSPARAQCRLCDAPSTSVSAADNVADVSLEIETSLDFGRIVVGALGDGTALLRPDGSAAASGSVVEPGARTMVGSAVVQGQPGKLVRVFLPPRIVLTSMTGGEILLEEVTSDLPAAPRLDGAGRLSFRIGGRLHVRGDAEGQYRGDLPVLVEYP
jgi:hypothetical protein